jgi:predicted dehydrogenase
VNFRGVFDASEERARHVSSELGIHAFDSLDALIAEVDALTIAVSTPAHYRVARAALRAGKHVLIEKPISSTLEEADELLEIAEKNGVVVQTGHVERFNRSIRAALPHVDSPRFIQSDRLAPFNMRGADVAVVLDLMIHDIDLVLTLVGDDASAVDAVGVPVLTPFVDIANARLGFRGGAIANITASRVSRERLRKIRIFQQSGYLSLDLAAGTGEFYRLKADAAGAAMAAMAQPGEAFSLESFVERIPLEAPEGEPLRMEMESFVAALRGESDVVVSGEAGRRALAVALRIVAEIERSLPALRGLRV